MAGKVVTTQGWVSRGAQRRPQGGHPFANRMAGRLDWDALSAFGTGAAAFAPEVMQKIHMLTDN
jgi:hypothetical protein